MTHPWSECAVTRLTLRCGLRARRTQRAGTALQTPVIEDGVIGAISLHALQDLLDGSLEGSVVFAHHHTLRRGRNGGDFGELVPIELVVIAAHWRVLICR